MITFGIICPQILKDGADIAQNITSPLRLLEARFKNVRAFCERHSFNIPRTATYIDIIYNQLITPNFAIAPCSPEKCRCLS